MTRLHNVLVVVTLLLATALAYGGANDRILLKDVSAITLKKGQWTTGRRSSPVPQISCVGGSAQYGPTELHPTTVQCKNTGFDGRDVQWRCDAELDERVRLGDISVSCEGYAHPDDPFILAGSCGLEYNLEYTSKGLKHQQQKQHSWTRSASSNPTYSADDSSFGWVSSFVYLICVFVVVGAVISCCGFGGPAIASAGSYSAYGAGVPYGAAVPPPSYNNYGGYGGYNAYGAPPAPSSGPGFWSGLATGVGASWLFNRPSRHSYYNSVPSSYNSSYSSSYDSSSSSASDSTSRTSSGYGGTKRR